MAFQWFSTKTTQQKHKNIGKRDHKQCDTSGLLWGPRNISNEFLDAEDVAGLFLKS